MIRIFVGYDSNEPVALSVLLHSLNAHSSRPLSVTPINLRHLSGIFERERNPLQATEFSFSRFLVPYLCDYEGWAIFMDCDMLARADIAELWDLRDERYAVMCVKHDHVPAEKTKFLGRAQTQYEKKNWSSLMLLNCSACTALTKDYVNTATGLELHQFKWLSNDDRIASLPHYWNFLVGYYVFDDNAKLVHFTEGGPYFPQYENGDFSSEWFAAFAEAARSADSDALHLARLTSGKPLAVSKRSA